MDELKNGKSKIIHVILIILIILLAILMTVSNLNTFVSMIFSSKGFSYPKSADFDALVRLILILVIDILLIANKDHKLSKGWCLVWFLCAAFIVLSILAAYVDGKLIESMASANIYYTDCSTLATVIFVFCERIESLIFYTPYLTYLPLFDLAYNPSVFSVTFTPQSIPWVNTAEAKCLFFVFALSAFNFISCWICLPHPKLKKLLKKDKTSVDEETT